MTFMTEGGPYTVGGRHTHAPPLHCWSVLNVHITVTFLAGEAHIQEGRAPPVQHPFHCWMLKGEERDDTFLSRNTRFDKWLKDTRLANSETGVERRQEGSREPLLTGNNTRKAPESLL